MWNSIFYKQFGYTSFSQNTLRENEQSKEKVSH